MALANDPSRLDRRISFGTSQSTINGNGIPTDHFVESFSVWCGIWNRSLAEKFQVIGSDHQDDITIIIRHNPNVNQSLLAQLKDGIYRVIDGAPDESPNPVKFDLVTLKKVTK